MFCVQNQKTFCKMKESQGISDCNMSQLFRGESRKQVSLSLHKCTFSCWKFKQLIPFTCQVCLDTCCDYMAVAIWLTHAAEGQHYSQCHMNTRHQWNPGFFTNPGNPCAELRLCLPLAILWLCSLKCNINSLLSVRVNISCAKRQVPTIPASICRGVVRRHSINNIE